MSEEPEREDLNELGEGLTQIANDVFEETAKLVKRLRRKSDWAADMADRFDNLAAAMQVVSAQLQKVAVEVAHLGADALESDRMPGCEFDDEVEVELDPDDFEDESEED